MSKIVEYFREVKSELFKVVWPSRKDTLKYSLTVILFSIGVALILGAADYGLLKIFETVLSK